eukprot:scaffold773_cov114-Isochrysis_galbana.AAC.3
MRDHSFQAAVFGSPNVAGCLKRVRCGMASANAASQRMRMPARTRLSGLSNGSPTTLGAIRPSACSSCRDARAVGRGCAPAVTCGGEVSWLHGASGLGRAGGFFVLCCCAGELNPLLPPREGDYRVGAQTSILM